MKKLVLLWFVLLLLPGCTPKSVVIPLGDDTYRVAKTGRWINTRGEKLMDQTYAEALEHCEQKGKKLLRIIKFAGEDMVHGENSIPATAVLEFECL